MLRIFLCVAALVALTADATAMTTVLFSDSFSRTIGEVPVLGPGTALNTDWGPNDNAAGGTIAQTYEVSNQHVDATSTWRSGALVDGSIGQLGYAHAEIQHDWATNPAVLAAGKLTVEFDLILTGSGSGHLGWWFGTSETVFEEATGAAGGGTPVSNANVDASVFFRVGGGTGGSFDSGTAVNNTFNIDPPMSTVFPNQIRLEVVTGNFQLGTPGSVELFINGSATPTDINGAAAGTAVNFVWDAEAAAYMGFSRNSSPALVSIDNLKISTVQSTSLPGDANSDGKVDLLDLDILGANFGLTTGATVAQGDFNSDAAVNLLDLDILGSNFGAMAPATVGIPEPATALLVSVSAATLLGSRRGRKS